MTELTLGQLIKIILGDLVFLAVVLGAYLFFKNYIIGFFSDYGNEAQNVLLGLVR